MLRFDTFGITHPRMIPAIALCNPYAPCHSKKKLLSTLSHAIALRYLPLLALIDPHNSHPNPPNLRFLIRISVWTREVA